MERLFDNRLTTFEEENKEAKKGIMTFDFEG